jgi:hypothetical protein
MPRSWGVRLAAAVLVVAALAGCGISGQGCGVVPASCTHGPTANQGALAQAAAIAAAMRFAPQGTTEPTVVWAAVEPDPFAPQDAAGRLVWEVRLTGALMASPCPLGFLDKPASPADKPCLDEDGGLVVVLDQFSGALLGWAH